MKRLLVFAVLFGVTAWAVQARASILGSNLLMSKTSFNGIEDEFKDQSKAEYVDRRVNPDGSIGVADGLIGPGDVSYGFAWFASKFSPNSEAGGVPATVLGVFSLMNGPLLGTSSFGNPVFDVVPVPKADLYSLWNMGLAAGQDKDWQADLDTAMAAAVGGNPTPGPMVVAISQVDGYNPALAGGTPAGDIALILGDDSGGAGVANATMNGWKLEIVAGLSTYSDFWEVQATQASPPPPGATPVSGTDIAVESAGLSILLDPGVPIWLPVAASHQLKVPPVVPDPSFHDIYVTSRVQNLVGGSYDSQDSTNFLYNPVPEPSTLLIWAGLTLLGCIAMRRRKIPRR